MKALLGAYKRDSWVKKYTEFLGEVAAIDELVVKDIKIRRRTLTQKFLRNLALKDDVAAKTKTNAAKYTKELSETGAKAETAMKNLFKKQLTCFKQLYKIDAGMKCLACDANYATKGLTQDGDDWVMAMNTSTCTRLKTACFDYLKAQQALNPYLLDMGRREMDLVNKKDIEYIHTRMIYVYDQADSLKEYYDERKAL